MSNVLNFYVQENRLCFSDGFAPVNTEHHYTQIHVKIKPGGGWDSCQLITAGFFVSADEITTIDSAYSAENEYDFNIPAKLLNSSAREFYFGIAGSYESGGDTVTIATNIVTVSAARGVLIGEQADVSAYEKLMAALNSGISDKMNRLSIGISDEILLSDGQHSKRSGIVISNDRDVIADEALSAFVVPTARAIGKAIAQTSSMFSSKLNKPVSSPNGEEGQLLRSKGNGETEWVNEGTPTDEQVNEAVFDWLEEHPEATTTVQDESLTANKLVKGTLGHVMPENFGAVGDGKTDDSLALQKAVTYCCKNSIGLSLNGEATYLISRSIFAHKPISIYGNGAKLLAAAEATLTTYSTAELEGISVLKELKDYINAHPSVSDSSGAMVVMNYNSYMPKKWTSVSDMSFDLNNRHKNDNDETVDEDNHNGAFIGLKIVNVCNLICRDLVFMQFENHNADDNKIVCGIYETRDTKVSSNGYERYFDTIVFYPSINSFRFDQPWASYIYCVYTERAGDDCWSNIVCHTCPRPFRMYNWTTMMNNIHLVGDQRNLLTDGCAFDLDGTGPYLMNNIYIDSCPYGFKKSKDSSLIASNVTMINPKSGDDLRPSKLFYLAGASSRHVLATAHINGFNAKYGNVALTGYSSGAALLDIKIANPENVMNLKSEGEAFYFGGTWNTDYFDGSLRLVNHFDGTFSIRGKLITKQAVSGAALIEAVDLASKIDINYDSQTGVIFYAPNGLAAGTYYFKWTENTGISKRTYCFTLTQAVPQDGRLDIDLSTPGATTIKSYDSAGSTEAKETVSLLSSSNKFIDIQYISQTGRILSAPNGLAAGTYHFKWNENTGINDGDYYFTITEPVPQGGQITIDLSTPGVPQIKTYSGQSIKVRALTPVRIPGEVYITFSDGTTVQGYYGFDNARREGWLEMKAVSGSLSIAADAIAYVDIPVTVIENVHAPWNEIQADVKNGDAPTKYPVGTEFGVRISGYGEARFVVLGHDQVQSFKNDKPGMISSIAIQYDSESGRLFTAPKELAARQYYFVWDSALDPNLSLADGKWLFKLNNDIPEDGYITISVPEGSDVPVLNTYADAENGEDPIKIESGIELTYFEDPRHTMLLGLKNVLSDNSGSAVSVQYDAPEALYYAENGLDANTKYYFMWSSNVVINSGNYWFKLKEPVPQGGQITIDVSAMKVNAYSSASSTTVIDTAVLSSGSDGTYLGATPTATSIADGEVYTGNLNQAHRCIYGNENYAQSAVRQLINSELLRANVWKPTHKFDRPPAWPGTLNGLVYALENSFVNVLRYAAVKYHIGNTAEISDTSKEDGIFRKNTDYILKDRFFLLSRTQIYGQAQGVNDEGDQVTFYSNRDDDADKKTTDNSGVTQTCFTRSSHSVTKLHALSNGGNRGSQYAKDNIAIMPCCIIA